jgi:methylated-DNA-[protein]-cysteine S-methyltransferase
MTLKKYPNIKILSQDQNAARKGSVKLRLDFKGTDFQKKMWQALLTIPFGETRSYGQLARQLGKPKAARAVGAANGKNPIAIITPCHRVIGASGMLTGFGLEAKAGLLSLGARKDSSTPRRGHVNSNSIIPTDGQRP